MSEPQKQQKVLIIDDDKFLLNMYILKFQNHGFTVCSAASGAEGLDKLKGGELPDIILLDLIMPVMDGFEFLEKMREGHLAEHAVVIVLSNQSQQADIDRAKKLGVQGYIVKASSIPSEVVSLVTDIYNKGNPKGRFAEKK